MPGSPACTAPDRGPDLVPGAAPTDDPLGAAVGRLREDAASRLDGHPGGRPDGDVVVESLSAVHDAVTQVAASAERATPGAFAGAAAAIRSLVPLGAEARLGIREAVLIALLRHGALEPAWTLAEDNASGVVRARARGITWAGGPQSHIRLPVPTLADGPRVYAWLPGFRDPRWQVPDSLYDITDRVEPRVTLSRLTVRSRHLDVAGAAWLTELTARRDDVVTVVLAGPGGSERQVVAERVRTPERVAESGPGLTRLAWAGWHAAVDLAGLRSRPGTWSLAIQVAQGGLRRSGALGPCRVGLGEQVCPPSSHLAAGRGLRLTSGPDGALALVVDPLSSPARLLSPPLRGRRSLGGR